MFSPDEYRFLRLCAGIWVATVVGIPFAIGLLTNEVKQQYNFTQGQLTTISTVANVVGVFALPAGMMWDAYGPKMVLLSAGVMIIGGFVLLALIFASYIQGTVLMFTIAFSAIGMASSWMDIASLMTNLFNFPLNNGDVVILQKTFMGLGATITSSFYSGWFDGQYVGYCVFTAASIALITAAGAGIIDLPPYVYRQRREAAEAKKVIAAEGKIIDLPPVAMETIDPDAARKKKADDAYDNVVLNVPADPRRIKIGFVLLAILMIYLTATQLITAYVHISATWRSLFAGFCLLMMMSFLAMPFVTLKQKSDLLMDKSGPELQNNATGGSDDDRTPRANDVTDVDLPRYDRTIARSLLKPDIWLLWWYAFCVWGAGTTIFSNSAQIYRSLNNNVYNSEVNAMYVAFIGIGSALGRVFCGLLEQKIITPRDLPMTLVLPISPVLLCIGLMAFLFLPVGGLLFSFTIFGIGFGWSWAATVLTTRRLFKTDVGKHYNFLFTAPMISTIIMNRYVFGTLYDNEATKQGHSIHCSGVACISMSMIVMTISCVTAGIGCVVVHFRWVRFLRRAAEV